MKYINRTITVIKNLFYRNQCGGHLDGNADRPLSINVCLTVSRNPVKIRTQYDCFTPIINNRQ
jgi:hypothetical protein